jgi:hypothetical protein
MLPNKYASFRCLVSLFCPCTLDSYYHSLTRIIMENSNFLVRNSAALTFKFSIDFCHCHHDKAMLLFMLVVLPHFIYWQESNHPMYHTPHQALAAFNKHPIENFHLLCGHGLRGRLHASVSRDSACGSKCCHAIVSTQG